MRLSLAIPIVLVCLAGSVLAIDRPTATHLSSYPWKLDKLWFGGFSAIELSDNGRSMVVLSDRATILTAKLVREGDKIVGVTPGPVHKIRSSRNKILHGSAGDSEGLVIDQNGRILVSFEGTARIAEYDRLGGKAKVLPRPDVFDTMPRNGGFEPLAEDARGRLYTMPEKARDADGNIPVYRWNGKRWSTPFNLPARAAFRPVGADFGPDGKLYLLERSTAFIGFRTRLRRWTVTESGVSDEETLLQTWPGTHDNLEGISVWRDAQGRLRATMISDDNFIVLQRTEIVEYVLPD